MTKDRIGALVFAVGYFCTAAAVVSLFAEQGIRTSHVDPLVFVFGCWGVLFFAAMLVFLARLWIAPVFLAMFGFAVIEAALRVDAGAHLALNLLLANFALALFIVVINGMAIADLEFERGEQWFALWHKPRKRRS